MKIALTFICLICGSMASADEPIEKNLVSIKRENSTYSYVRIGNENNIEWQLRHQPSGDVVLRFFHDKENSDTSIFTYSNLIDVVQEEDQFGVLLSLDVGLLYIRCSRGADGTWTENWRQRIIGASGPNKNIASIKLEKLDTVGIASDDGGSSKFVLSKSEVKKDGASYVPSKGLSIKGGSTEISK